MGVEPGILLRTFWPNTTKMSLSCSFFISLRSLPGMTDAMGMIGHRICGPAKSGLVESAEHAASVASLAK